MTTISRLTACGSVLMFSMISSGVPIGWVARRAARLASATPTSAVWRLRYRAKERVERDNAPSESASEGVPAQARHLADDLVGRRESGRAVGERGGDVLRIRGQDEQWMIVLEDDARVHEAARARARLVGDLRDEGVAEGDPEAGGQVLEGAGVVVLVLGVDGHLLVEGELAVVDGLEGGHHDGDLPRARRGHRGVSEPVGRLARGEVLEVPARLEGEGVAQRVHPRDQVSHQGLLAPWVVMTGGPASALLPRRSRGPGR